MAQKCVRFHPIPCCGSNTRRNTKTHWNKRRRFGLCYFWTKLNIYGSRSIIYALYDIRYLLVFDIWLVKQWIIINSNWKYTIRVNASPVSREVLCVRRIWRHTEKWCWRLLFRLTGSRWHFQRVALSSGSSAGAELSSDQDRRRNTPDFSRNHSGLQTDHFRCRLEYVNQVTLLKDEEA